jgi:hypothetical protein
MILSDREIGAALARRAIRITPDPGQEAWSSTALDLHLAKDLLFWKKPSSGGVESVVCPASEEFDFEFVKRTYSEPIQIPSSGYVFRSHTFLLAWTQEAICLLDRKLGSSRHRKTSTGPGYQSIPDPPESSHMPIPKYP